VFVVEGRAATNDPIGRLLVQVMFPKGRRMDIPPGGLELVGSRVKSAGLVGGLVVEGRAGVRVWKRAWALLIYAPALASVCTILQGLD
jgi:hypothetical protein